MQVERLGSSSCSSRLRGSKIFMNREDTFAKRLPLGEEHEGQMSKIGRDFPNSLHSRKGLVLKPLPITNLEDSISIQSDTIL